MEGVEQNIRVYLGDKPEIVRLFEALEKAHVRWALYAGCETAILTSNRTPTDVDVIVHDDDFEKAAMVAPMLRRYDDETEVIITGDQQKVGFVASGLVGKVGSTDVDIMARASFVIDNRDYPIRLTNTATANRLQYMYDNAQVFLANPFDTILIKAFMRRGAEQSKFDRSDATALVTAGSLERSYVAHRLEEVGVSAEALKFLQEINAVGLDQIR